MIKEKKILLVHQDVDTSYTYLLETRWATDISTAAWYAYKRNNLSPWKFLLWRVDIKQFDMADWSQSEGTHDLSDISTGEPR